MGVIHRPEPREDMAQEQVQVRVCEHCGHRGATAAGDVIWAWERVGGRGYQYRLLCADRLACWQRWEDKHLVPLLRQAVAAPTPGSPEA